MDCNSKIIYFLGKCDKNELALSPDIAGECTNVLRYCLEQDLVFFGGVLTDTVKVSATCLTLNSKLSFLVNK